MFSAFVLGLYLATGALPSTVSACPSQCSCFYHNLSDGSKARSVICNEPETSLVPAGFPVDTSKLRIEKTAIQRIPGEAFSYLSSLEFLWMSFNALRALEPDSFRGLSSLEELRLDGNALTAFPWESVADMLSLRLLDLHNNQLSSMPAEAAAYTKNITYLDVSSNNLLTLPPELLSSWLAVKAALSTDSSKMILGLHDNPWVCDCRLYDLVRCQKAQTLPLAFIDTQLRCSAPDSLSGVLFRDTDLRRCVTPRVHTAVARVRSAVGNNVLLRCGATGVPSPDLSWRRDDGKSLNGTVQQETSKEGIIWSILRVPAVSSRDSGKYVCKAANYAGGAEAVVSLAVSDSPRLPTNQTGGAAGGKKPKAKKPNGVVKAAYQEKLVARYVAPPTPSPPPPPRAPQEPGAGAVGYSAAADKATPATSGLDGLPDKTDLSNLTANASSQQQDPKRVVRQVKVVGDTDSTIALNWRAPKATNATAFSVLYAVFGERDMRRINVGAGKNRVMIDGLVPQTKYIACVCVRGLIPRKEQCVIFSTDEAAKATGTQKLINGIILAVALIIAVPLTVIVCCGALKRRVKKYWGKKPKDVPDSYVTFETLSPGAKARGLEAEYLTRPDDPEESNRLLSARSSLDSEAAAPAAAEGQPDEYFC